MRNSKLFTFALSAVLTGLVTSAPALQAQQGQQAPPAAQQAPDIEVTDADLQSFAEAQGKIVKIQEDYAGRMQSAQDPEKANALRQEANEKMISAVEATGLDVESFNQIAMAIQNDPELQQRLQQLRQQ